jgi:hypothetical protein
MKSEQRDLMMTHVRAAENIISGGVSCDAAHALASHIRELLAENERLLAAVRAAYWHLDTYGFPNHPDPDLMKSQQNVFDLVRPHCPPIPGRL